MHLLVWEGAGCVLVGVSPPRTWCPCGLNPEAKVTAHLHTALAAAG